MGEAHGPNLPSLGVRRKSGQPAESFRFSPQQRRTKRSTDHLAAVISIQEPPRYVKVTLINGDGISRSGGRTRKILRQPRPLNSSTGTGAEVANKYGTNLPNETVESVMRNGVGLKGPTATGIGEGQQSANVGLRKRLDLFASLRPVKSVPGVKTRYENVDLVVVRENTEDLYAGIEHVVVPGVVESIKIITEKASTRICRFAFEYATKHQRKKVSAVHKANIMKLSDGSS